ncbi:pilus assembly protein PilN [Acetobacter sp. TBRC 12305]|uniref:Pilus assembly protein PilN n=1 Tax=Acetobacter garciniae TaxID=2817435 RepID=A0A939KP09_9PROT|nr:pilus assembly protein PilN [Acetobacter garciniae]MBO1326275.1 pilus assembly protein PilN [Acetobacter garciniae]MBX0345987.1 pilus assembly protein PilN [Acetobacter garciniae]
MRMRRLFLSSALSLALSGCTEFQNAQKQEKDFLHKSDTMDVPGRDLITVSDKPYLVGEPIHVADAVPAILLERAEMSVARPVSLREAATMVSIKTGIPIHVTQDADDDTEQSAMPSMVSAPVFNGVSLPAPPSSQSAAAGRTIRHHAASASWNGRGQWLDYTGTRYGLFTALAARFGVSQRWVEETGTEEFFRNITRTYVIPAFEGETTNTTAITAVAGGGGSGSGSGSGMNGMSGMSTGSTGGMGGTNGSSGQNQSQGMTGVYEQIKTNRWKHLEEAARLAGNGADVLADPGIGTLTAAGTPDQIAGIDTWYAGLKSMLMKQVAVTVRVYSLKFSRESNYGFSPTVAAKEFGKYFAASATPAAIPTIQSQDVPFSFGASIVKGKMSGTNLAAQALQSLDNATEIDERGVVTTNGVPAPFQHGTNTTYVQYAASYLATNAGSSSSLSPGVVMAGFEGAVTPRVIDDQIVLNLHFLIQTLLSMGTASGSTGMQLPKTANTTVTDSVVLKSGEMLVLSGYVGDSTSRAQNGVGSPWNFIFGGGGDAQNLKDRILITVEAHTL